MTTPIISILIATIPGRICDDFPRIVKELLRQKQALAEHKNLIEIIGFFDTQHRTIGAKRNGLLALAQGSFLAFVDDDDSVAPNYLAKLFETVSENPTADVVVFDQQCQIDDNPPYHCVYGIEYDYVYDGGPLWTGKPAHTMLWASRIAKAHRFPDLMFGEDSAWARACSLDVKYQARIGETLYYYHFNSKKTASRHVRPTE